MHNDFKSFMAIARNVKMPNAARALARDNVVYFALNNTPFDPRLIQAAKAVTMPKKEKQMRRAQLEQFISHGASRPVEEGTGVSFFQLLALQFPAIAVIVALFVTVGGGAAFAAEFALPGDTLYSLKVAIVEPIRGQLAFSQEAKAEWEVERIDRRMVEAEKLARKGELTPVNREVLEKHIQKHMVDLEDRMVILAEDKVSPVSVQTALVETLVEHEEAVPHDQSGAIIQTEMGRLMIKTIEHAGEIDVPVIEIADEEKVQEEASSSSSVSESSESSSSSLSSRAIANAKSSAKTQTILTPFIPSEEKPISTPANSSSEAPKVILKPQEPKNDDPKPSTPVTPVIPATPLPSEDDTPTKPKDPEPVDEEPTMPVEPDPTPIMEKKPVEKEVKEVPQRVSPPQTIYIEIMN